MRAAALFFLGFGLATGTAARPAAADDKATAKALEELQGTYLVVGLEAKGEKVGEKELKLVVEEADRTVVIKGNQLAMKFVGTKDTATIKPDPTQKPARIDITKTNGDTTGVNHGIYKVDNGLLVICAAEKGGESARPTDFKGGENIIVLTLKKQPAK